MPCKWSSGVCKHSRLRYNPASDQKKHQNFRVLPSLVMKTTFSSGRLRYLAHQGQFSRFYWSKKQEKITVKFVGRLFQSDVEISNQLPVFAANHAVFGANLASKCVRKWGPLYQYPPPANRWPSQRGVALWAMESHAKCSHHFVVGDFPAKRAKHFVARKRRRFCDVSSS